jgi:mono/diheme cytochrome c family protein
MKKFPASWLAACSVLPFVFYHSLSQNQPRPQEKQVIEGRRIFLRNCASCHGMDGAGGGIVSAALKKEPSDLTRIPLQDGKFPTQRLVMAITGELSLPIHGQREMPVWGSVLSGKDVTNLVTYLETIQKPLANLGR